MSYLMALEGSTFRCNDYELQEPLRTEAINLFVDILLIVQSSNGGRNK
jgi:hypothetical protein